MPTSLDIKIVKGLNDAPDYNKDTLKGHIVQPAKIISAVIIPGSTEAGKCTVDLQIGIQDPEDKIWVRSAASVIITGALLVGLADAIKGVEARGTGELKAKKARTPCGACGVRHDPCDGCPAPCSRCGGSKKVMNGWRGQKACPKCNPSEEGK